MANLSKYSTKALLSIVSNEKSEKARKEEATKILVKRGKMAQPDIAEQPAESKENSAENWKFKVGEEVMVRIAKNAKENAGKMIAGTVIRTKVWKKFREYIVTTEFGKFIKREGSLAKK